MRTIRARLVVLVATAAIAPLLAYGVVSLQLLRSATSVSVTGEAETVAGHAAAEIGDYVQHNLDLLRVVAEDLQYAALTPDQQAAAQAAARLEYEQWQQAADQVFTPVRFLFALLTNFGLMGIVYCIIAGIMAYRLGSTSAVAG